MYKTTLKDVKENKKNFNKKSPYIIKFQIGDDLFGTYRVSKEKFLAIKMSLSLTTLCLRNLKRLNVLKQEKFLKAQMKPNLG